MLPLLSTMGVASGTLLAFIHVDWIKVVENLNGNIPEGLAEPIITRFANANNDKGKGKDNGKGGGWKSEPYGGGGSWGQGSHFVSLDVT